MLGSDKWPGVCVFLFSICWVVVMIINVDVKVDVKVVVVNM